MSSWAEFTSGGFLYRCKILCALDQWYVLRRVQTLIPALASLEADSNQDLSGALMRVSYIAEALNLATDDDVDYLFDLCLGCTEVFSTSVDNPRWGPCSKLTAAELLEIVSNVILQNLGPLYRLTRPKFNRTSPPSKVELVSLPDGLDWIQRPVLRGLCSQEAVRGGVLHIEDFARMNDALDVWDENDYRANQKK